MGKGQTAEKQVDPVRESWPRRGRGISLFKLGVCPVSTGQTSRWHDLIELVVIGNYENWAGL
jgi:hypothetical protein